MFTVYDIETSEIYGHGKRLVIWFSGCTLQCKGCINSHLWKREAGKEISLYKMKQIIQEHDDIVGITYIGGEPLEQGIELLKLTKWIVKQDLDIVLFTGYELEELNGAKRNIFDLSSVAVVGRFDITKRDTNLLLRGSLNQKIIIHNDNIKKYYQFEYKQVEIIINENENKYLGFLEDFV